MRALLLLLAACAGPPPVLSADYSDAGLEVRASAAIDTLAVWDASGQLIARQTLPNSAETAFLTAPWTPGERYRITAGGAELWVQAPVRGPVAVEIEAPIGQGRQSVAAGARIPVVAIGEGSRGALVLTAREPGPVRVRLGAERSVVAFAAVGDRHVLPFDLDDVSDVDIGGLQFAIDRTVWSVESARQAIVVESVHMPTDALGAIDRARPPDRVTLPSAWWRSLLRRGGLGFRPRDDQAPWGWQSVQLRNTSESAVHLVVRATVVDENGQTAPAFQPRLRESSAEFVQVLLRVPAGQRATASLPIFAAGDQLPNNQAFARRVEVIALGSSEPLHRIERPLWVSRGSRWASGWLVAALLASGSGWLWLILGARRWIARSPTADLLTVALFGSVTWVAGTALQVAGLGVSAVLGPFAPLLTGIADDALRACLLGTLIALVPRPGTAALATAVGFVMRGLTMGTFHPVDLLYVGSAVFWLELWLWIAGCTRGRDWRDRDWEVWLRLSVGLGASNVCAAATAIVVSVVFYRLYFADWYVALILALPGFLYVTVGCGLAVGFSRALRRVEG